jgi:hypothetical protein
MNDTTWILILVGLTMLGGRLVKLYPKLPKGLMPVLSMVLGAGIYLGKACLLDGMALTEALACWQVVITGAGAIVGHDLLKPALVRLLGERGAVIVLGQLPKPDPKPKPENATGPASIIFVGLLALSLSGCALLSKLAGSQLLTNALDLGMAGAQQYYARHPNQASQQAVIDAELALLRAQLDYARDGSPEHEAAVDAAYRAWYAAMADVIAARVPDGGAMGMGPDGEALPPLQELDLPTPDEVAEAR